MNRKRETELVEKMVGFLRSFSQRQILRLKLHQPYFNVEDLTDKEWLWVIGRACRIVEAEL